MPYDFKNIPDAYELISEEYIEDVASQAALIRHKKTGARVAVLSNDDDNKVFNICFRTPPKDSTGVAHITEHSVLCGSREFPAKDPFAELLKGSLNTFLNALTYPDKTTYPVASCNDSDFKNLMHIYLDAVFYPNIYIHDEIFRQEGWHYELKDKDAPLCYNGVVYNEMKGAFSSPEEVLFRKVTNSLYPDTIYGVESGGDPDVIPELRYQEFLDFHRRYYHPSNSYIYLYGDMDVTERLEFIDRQYLSAFDAAPVDSHIPFQKAFDNSVYVQSEYPADNDDSGAYLACSWVVGENGDVREYLAFQILEYLLMEAPGAPLKQALQDRHFGEDIFGNFESSVLQPYISIIIKNMDPGDRDEILAVIREELQKLADGALNRRSVEGAVNAMEFKSREADFGRWPKGLMYGLQMMDSWLYDDNAPFAYMKYQPAFDFFRENLDTGYFNELIRKRMLDNPHSSVLMVTPRAGLTARNEKILADKLAAYKASLSEGQIEDIVRQTKELKEYQSEASPKEVLEKIPLLSTGDIKKEAEPLFNEEIAEDGFKLVLHDIDTNGIAYVNLLFNVQHIPADEVPYLGILAEVMGELDTSDYSYSELTDEINLHTGGLKTNTVVFEQGNVHDYVADFSVSGKALYAKLPELFKIFDNIINATDYSDQQHIRDILSQVKSRLEMSLMGSGHAAAVGRASAYYSEEAWFKELTEGLEFYRFVSRLLGDFDNRKQELSRELESLSRRIFRKDLLIADWTSDRQGLDRAAEYLDSFAGHLSLPEAGAECEKMISVGTCPARREAFTTPGTVQYNCCAGDFADAGFPYSGAMNVMKNILSNEYLWNQVRTKGGAYGCMCGFSPMGDAYFTSYRDPNLADTFEVYKRVADYLRNFELDEREMRKYIIGAFGAVDTPMTASMKGARSMASYMTGRGYDELQKSRNEMLSVTEADIRAFGDVIDAVVGAGYICVIGSESAIMKEKNMFDRIEPLLTQTGNQEK